MSVFCCDNRKRGDETYLQVNFNLVACAPGGTDLSPTHSTVSITWWYIYEPFSQRRTANFCEKTRGRKIQGEDRFKNMASCGERPIQSRGDASEERPEAADHAVGKLCFPKFFSSRCTH